MKARKVSTNLQMNTKGINNKYLLLPHKGLVSGGDSREGTTPNSDIKRGVGLGTRNIKMTDCASLQRRTEEMANIARQSPLLIMKSRQVNRLNKIKLYETIIRSVTWNVSEVWTLSQTEEIMFNVFKRKVLRKIYGPEWVNGQWRNRYNHEICNLYKEMDLTRNIRLRRVQWMGHVMRMKDERVLNKVLKEYTERRRPVGSPKRRWLEAVGRDAKRRLKYGNWRSTEDRDCWRRRIEEAKARVGL